ncbi:hypothetical protein ACFWP3_01820 [Streptomyces sp. NPDC058525]|uniref:hypothetical protein n=1 Tax=Streptomyces sp. NPDC058525 TaxID=3346538 RepID=UPI003662F643
METTDDLARLRAALAQHDLVNLTGGLGTGKSRLAARLPVAAVLEPGEACDPAVLRGLAAGPGGLLLIDGVDGPGQAEALAASLYEACGPPTPGHGPYAVHPPRPVLLVSRIPLRAAAGWAEAGPVTVTVGPRPPEAVEAQARAAGITDPQGLALVVRLAGGVPLLAELACRALHSGIAPDAPGAAADLMTGEVLERLGRERPGRRWRHALRLLATVRAGDEHLVAGGPALFSTLAGLSVVRRERLGLAVREPYRSLFELAYQWRRPNAHAQVRTRAADYRGALLAGSTAGPEERAGLVEQGLFLSGDPLLRSTLFPPAEDGSRIGPARPEEAQDVERLMHRWAVRGGFDVRRSRTITERWLADGPSSFRLARDRDGRPVGLAALVPVGAGTEGGIEPLLQQHTAALGAGGRPGLFLGAAYGADPVTHAQILRDILVSAVHAGHLVVSTASPDYQALLRTLTFRPHGGIRDDVYRCGRRPEVYSHDFSAARLPGWMRALAPPPPGSPFGGRDAAALVAWALARLGDPAALSASPLLSGPQFESPDALRGWLRCAVLDLADAESRADAEAGAILQAYYLGRDRTHHQVARRLHLSRATYFRRLRRGLALVAARLPG